MFLKPTLKSKKIILLFLVVLSYTFSFAGPGAPEYLRTKDWEINRLSSTVIIITAKVVFYNPNKAKAKLNELELDILFNEKFIGKVIQSDIVKINGRSSFDIPIHIKFDLKESGFNVSNVLGLISNKKFIVDLQGYLKARVFLMPFKVRIDERQEFKVADFF